MATNNANITIVTGSPLCGPANSGMPPSSALVGSCLTAGSAFQLSPATGGAASVRILSFNIWGIFNSKYRKQRLMHFGATKVKDYDVICLQEQFEEADFRLLVESIPEPLRHQLYYKRFPSSFIGSGLAVISRFEITHAQYCVYPTQSYPEKVYHGDCYAKKGVAMVRLLVPTSSTYINGVGGSTAPSHNVSSHSLNGSSTMGGGGRGGDRDVPTTELTVYTTHLVAQYEKISRLGSFEKEMYAHYRISQVMTLATFICSTSRPCDNIVLCGDFNASPSSPELKLLLAYCQCRGGLDFVRTLVDDDASNFTYTYDNQFNTDSTSYLKFMDMQEDIPVQLDHIFFCGKQMSLVPAEVGNLTDVAPCFHNVNYEAPHGVVVFTNNKEVQTGNVGCPTCPLSDHFGVVARFLVAPSGGGGVPATPLPTSSRVMASASFASVHPPALVVDPSGHRKSLEFAASFLGRSAAGLRMQSTRMTRVVCLVVLLPLVMYALESLFSERAAQSEQGVLGTLISLGSAFLLYPVVMFVLGAGCLVTLLLARVQRVNDAVVMGWQAEELRSLVSSCDWS